MDNFLILKEIKNHLLTDSSIINFSEKIYDKIQDAMLNGFVTARAGLPRYNNPFSKFQCLKRLDLKYSGIEIIDGQLFTISSLEELDISYCSIFSIQEYSFMHLKNLKILDLSHNDLKFLMPQKFYGLERLEKLDVSNNEIDYLFDGEFSPLKSLKSLNLSRNLLQTINKGVLNGLDMLEYFQLEHHSQEILLTKDTLKNPVNLKHVNLSYDCPRKRKYQVDLPKNLEQVDLKLICRDLTLIKWVLQSENLRRLKLTASKQIFDSELFENCHNLEEISLEKVHFNMDQFPSNLTKLRDIELVSIKFLKDPKDLFSNLNNLEDVKIKLCEFQIDQHNRLLFESLKNLRKLTYMTDMEITSKDNNCSIEPKYLYGNLLKGRFILISTILQNNPNLVELNLNKNSARIAGLEGCKGLKHLESLCMSENKISDLRDGLFNRLVNLKQLDLSGNTINSINNKIFSKQLRNLVDLSLSSNF